MNTAQTVLAIDQGTSGTKAIVFDAEDGVLAHAEVGIHPHYGAGGSVEVDPGALLRSVLGAGRRAIADAGRPVQAVSLANQGETVLAWDRVDGRPLSAAVVWQDRRAETITAGLAEHAERVAEHTGLMLDPYFSAPKMAWLRRNVTTDGVVTTSDTWLVHQLCGAFVTDVSTASRSLLTGLDSPSWDADLLDLFGLSGEELPTIVGCDEVVGTTSRFGDDLPVAGLIVDQQAALLAESCLNPGAAKCTFGTGAFLLANTGQIPVRSTAGLTASVAWRLRGETSYCLDGQVYAAASAVRWLEDLGLISGPHELDALAVDDPQGVLCVPALAGLAAPWWRADATATFAGLTLSSERAHLVTAVLQGIAAQVAEITDSIATDLGSPLTSLRVDGGLVRSRSLMQAVADITQLAVDVYPWKHATALGAAGTARLALDRDLTVAEAAPQWSPEVSIEPVWSADRAADFRGGWTTVAVQSAARRSAR